MVKLPSDALSIYLDYAATAPLGVEAREAMEALLSEPLSGLFAGAGNANALYGAGRAAFRRLEAARAAIAERLGVARPSEIVLCSSATEADNAAILGIAEAAFRRAHFRGVQPAVIFSALEHEAVRKTADVLRARGFIVRELRPDRDGFIEARELARALDESTVLVSVQLANSEVGSIQPVAELAALAHEYGALFHSDCVQALGKIAVDLQALEVDAATFSSHKIGGPPGIAALYLRRGTPFHPLIVGGGQESGRRSGTQNVVGAVGFAAAVDAAVRLQERESTRLRQLRDRLYEALPRRAVVQAAVDVKPGSYDYLPSLAAFLVSGFESETLVLRFDELGFCVSGGSACSSGSLEPSHGLLSMGVPSDLALGALRVSMGRETTDEEVEAFIAATDEVLNWRVESR